MATKLVRFHGNTARLLLDLAHPDTGTAFNPAGYLLLFTVKRSPDLADAEALIQKISTVGGITAIGASQIAVDLVPADAAEVTTRVEYYFDVLAQHVGSGALLTVANGRLEFQAVVTREAELSVPTFTTQPGATSAATHPLLAATITTAVQHRALPTVGATLPWVILTREADLWVTWTLRARTVADPSDADIAGNVNGAGEFFRVPNDFNAGTNNVIWQRTAFL